MVAFGDVSEKVGDVALHALRSDPVLNIICELLLAAAAGLGERAFHRTGNGAGVEDDPAFDVPGSPPDRLDQ